MEGAKVRPDYPIEREQYCSAEEKIVYGGILRQDWTKRLTNLPSLKGRCQFDYARLLAKEAGPRWP
jgi:hypothetical protein